MPYIFLQRGTTLAVIKQVLPTLQRSKSRLVVLWTSLQYNKHINLSRNKDILSEGTETTLWYTEKEEQVPRRTTALFHIISFYGNGQKWKCSVYIDSERVIEIVSGKILDRKRSYRCHVKLNWCWLSQIVEIRWNIATKKARYSSFLIKTSINLLDKFVCFFFCL